MTSTSSTLTSDLDPNVATAHTPAVTGTPASGGSTMAMGTDNDQIALSPDVEMAIEGIDGFDDWDVRALFRDWGDTAGTGDGGFENGRIGCVRYRGGRPIIRSTTTLADRFVNATAMAYYAFTVTADGTAAATGATSVAIPATTDAVQSAAMVFSSGSLVPAQTQDLNVNPGETFAGTYFGAPGQFNATPPRAPLCGTPTAR